MAITITSPSLGGTLNHKNFFFQNSLWEALGKKVRFCRIDSQYINKKVKKKLKVHFQEDEYVVNPMYQKKITNFIKDVVHGLETIKMRAHADSCGSEDYNKKLSENRANTVYAEMSKIMTFNNQIQLDIKGEAESHDHGKKDRYVEIELTARPKQNDDYMGIVIIDASASAARLPTASGIYWSQVPNLKFRDKTLIYVVRSAGTDCKGTNLKDYKPEGHTVFKEARYIINKYAKGKMNISIVSDGKQFKKRIYEDKLKKLEKKVKDSKQAELTFNIW